MLGEPGEPVVATVGAMVVNTGFGLTNLEFVSYFPFICNLAETSVKKEAQATQETTAQATAAVSAVTSSECRVSATRRLSHPSRVRARVRRRVACVRGCLCRV